MLFKMLWGSLNLVLGALGGLLGPLFALLGGVSVAPRISKAFLGDPLGPHLGPRGASKSPTQLPKRPHGEAEGPTKPPTPIWKRISAYLPTLPPSKT